MGHENTLKLKWATETAAKVGDGAAATNKTRPFYAGLKPCDTLIKWGGTCAGTLTLYASVNHNPEDSATALDPWNGDWNPVDTLLSPAPTDPAGAPGNNQYSLNGLSFRAYYWDYVRSGGSGALEAWFGREVSA